jgi:hypothetical protein
VRLIAASYPDPQVEHIVEIDVGEQRQGAAILWRPFFHLYLLPILQHACVQPLLDKPHDAPIRNPVVDGIERTSDTLPTVTSTAIPSGYELSGHAIRWRVKR